MDGKPCLSKGSVLFCEAVDSSFFSDWSAILKSNKIYSQRERGKLSAAE